MGKSQNNPNHTAKPSKIKALEASASSGGKGGKVEVENKMTT